MAVRMRAVAFLLLFAFVTSAAAVAGAAGRIPAAYAPVLKALRAVKIPILLPTEFGEVALEPPGPAVVTATFDAHHYYLHLDATTGCSGADACSIGRVLAGDRVYRKSLTDEERREDPVVETGPRVPDNDAKKLLNADHGVWDKRVRLAHGLTGYYTNLHRGDVGERYLRFEHKGIVYSFGAQRLQEKQLVDVVNSAIGNGPVKP